MTQHNHLLGTWQSHRAKTFATFKGYESLTLSRKQKLGRIFGHLQIRYTNKNLCWTLDGETSRETYSVIAEDQDSLVLETICRVTETQRLHHLHFETIRGQDYYWIGLGHYSEWFRRIS